MELGEKAGTRRIDRRDYYGGALLVLIGIAAAYQGRTYGVGSLTNMGSGFFPTCVGILLALVGIGVAGSAATKARFPDGDALEGSEKALPSQWRGWLCIGGGVAAFTVLGKWGGLLPATFAIVFISAFGDNGNTWKSAVILAASICVVSVVIFWWALQLQFPLFSWG